MLEYFEKVVEEQGGDDVIFDRMAVAEPRREIIKSFINPRTGKPFSHGMLSFWIHRGGEERIARWKAAREMAAHHLVEEAGEILDGTEERNADDGPVILDSAGVALRRARAEHRKWLAERYNRDIFGTPDNTPAVQINLGDLHLEALQTAGSRALPATPEDTEEQAARGADEDPDYEIVETPALAAGRDKDQDWLEAELAADG